MWGGDRPDKSVRKELFLKTYLKDKIFDSFSLDKKLKEFETINLLFWFKHSLQSWIEEEQLSLSHPFLQIE